MNEPGINKWTTIPQYIEANNSNIIQEKKCEIDEKSEISYNVASTNVFLEEEKKHQTFEKIYKNRQIEYVDNVEEKYNKLFKRFENNQLFTKSTLEFIKKLETHFKNKRNIQECTSFINTIHNLYTQHIGKLSK